MGKPPPPLVDYGAALRYGGTMKHAALVACIAFIGLGSACGGEGIPDSGMDSSVPDAGPPDPHVRFVIPTTSVHASSQTVPVQVVADVLVDRVDLVVDGVLVTNLVPPYSWNLVTSGLAPGDHVVLPRALLGGTSFDGPSFVLTIDRVPPMLQSIAPATGGLMPGSFAPIVVTFDEPLDPENSQVTVTVDQYTPGSATPTSGTLSISGATVTFTPSIRWLEGIPVVVIVGGTAQDFAGNQKACSGSANPTVRTYWHNGQTIGQATEFSSGVPGTRDFFFTGFHPAFNGATFGTVDVYGSIGGLDVVFAPALEAGFTTVQGVSGGMDRGGAAYLLIQEYNGGTFDRALVVQRRDPSTHAWSGQVIVDASDPAYILNPTFFAAPNGHAFVQYLERTNVSGNLVETLRTYHRGPSDSSFALDTAYDVVNFALPVAFPGTSGRFCVPEGTFHAGTGTTTYAVNCRGGGVSAVSLPMTTAQGNGVSLGPVSVNARGDATWTFGADVYVFDGPTETLTKTTNTALGQPFTWSAVGIGNAGHVCLAYATNAQASRDGLYVARKAPGAAFGAEQIAATYPDILELPARVAVDEAGHCFISSTPGTVVHDATYDGAWSIPFAYLPTSAPGLFAGATNEAYLVSSDGAAFVHHFAPLTP